jgi:transcription initiation factor TFIIIB Brf1 subunit/transcription initiation factor TFIIB
MNKNVELAISLYKERKEEIEKLVKLEEITEKINEILERLKETTIEGRGLSILAGAIYLGAMIEEVDRGTMTFRANFNETKITQNKIGKTLKVSENTVRKYYVEIIKKLAKIE